MRGALTQRITEKDKSRPERAGPLFAQLFPLFCLFSVLPVYSVLKSLDSPFPETKSLTFRPILHSIGLITTMQTRYYYWFAFTYRFPWVGSGQGRIARVSR
jgi:hypothetical protein